MPRKNSVMALSFVLSLAAVAACSSEADVAPPDPQTAPLEGTTDALPSEVSPPSVYVAKVKNVLVGLPATDEEVKAVTADPAKLGTQDAFEQEAIAFVDWLRQSPPAPGSEKVRIAGEPEKEARAKREVDGIAVDDSTWGEIVDAGRKVGLSIQ